MTHGEVVFSTIMPYTTFNAASVVYNFNMKVKVVLRVANYVWQKKRPSRFLSLHSFFFAALFLLYMVHELIVL